jgi:hypothetical protein
MHSNSEIQLLSFIVPNNYDVGKPRHALGRLVLLHKKRTFIMRRRRQLSSRLWAVMTITALMPCSRVGCQPRANKLAAFRQTGTICKDLEILRSPYTPLDT